MTTTCYQAELLVKFGDYCAIIPLAVSTNLSDGEINSYRGLVTHNGREVSERPSSYINIISFSQMAVGPIKGEIGFYLDLAKSSGFESCYIPADSCNFFSLRSLDSISGKKGIDFNALKNETSLTDSAFICDGKEAALTDPTAIYDDIIESACYLRPLLSLEKNTPTKASRCKPIRCTPVGLAIVEIKVEYGSAGEESVTSAIKHAETLTL